MSLGHGASIVRDGLVFSYDMQNTQKSLKGAPTTNLLTNPDFASGNTGYNNYVSTGPTTVIVTDFPGSIGVPKTVLECTSAAAPGGGGNSGGMVFANPTLTTGQAYTISFWARILSHSSATNTFSNQSGSGDNSNFAFTKTITSEWVKYSYTTSSLDLMKTSWYVWTNLNSARWQYADFQIEQNTFETPFIRGTRTNTQAILDLTNNNTITANSLTYASNNTFTFNGTNNSITIGQTINYLPALSNFTLEVWFRTSSFPTAAAPNIYNNTTRAGVLFGAAYYSGAALYWNGNATGTALSVYAYIRGQDAQRNTSAKSISLNTWTHLVLVNNNTASKLQFYVDGVLFNEIAGATQEYNPTLTPDAGNIGFCKPQVDGGGELVYSNLQCEMPVARIYKNKALSATEVAQNYNAHRGRYGI